MTLVENKIGTAKLKGKREFGLEVGIWDREVLPLS